MLAEIKINLIADSKVKDFDFEHIDFGKAFADHQFTSDFDGKNWVNLEINPYGPMSMSPAISALHYGQAIFEGMKAYKSPEGEPLLFRPEDNWKRLNKSAKRLAMPEIPYEVFMDGLTELIKTDAAWIPTTPGSALYIRPFMFATDTFIGVRPSTTYRFCIFCCPVNAYYSNPLSVMVSSEYSRASRGGVGDVKCAGNYATSMLPAKQAQDMGYHQVLWTDSETHEIIEETGTTNIFIRIGNKIITPVLDGTLLAGITRDSIIHLLKHWNIELEERHININEIIDAYKNGTLKEIFASGTAATIVAIEKIGYKGEDYELSSSGNWELMNKLKNTLENIKSGKETDPFGWIVKL